MSTKRSGAADRPAPEPARLGALEQQVMDILWADGPQSIREIIEKLPGEPAYTTIATVLRNLERKRMTSASRRRGSVRHRAAHDRDQYAAQLMQHALTTSGDRASSMLHFVEALSPTDIEVLRRYVTEHADDPPEQS